VRDTSAKLCRTDRRDASMPYRFTTGNTRTLYPSLFQTTLGFLPDQVMNKSEAFVNGNRDQ